MVYMPSGRFAANAAWLAGPGDGPQPGPLDGADRSGRADRDHQDPPAAVLRPGRTARRAGEPVHPASPQALALGRKVQLHLGPCCEPFHSRPDAARPLLTCHPANRTPRQLAPVRSASASCRVLSRHLAHHSHCRPPSAPPKAPADRRQPPVYPNSSPDHRACNFLTPLPLPSRRPSVSTGGFGLICNCPVPGTIFSDFLPGMGYTGRQNRLHLVTEKPP